MSRPNSQRPLTYYAWLSIIAAILTLGLKTAAWKMTGSVGLLSDALESIVNVIASFIALATVWVSARPADEDHAYGHTKVEYFASGFEGGLILIAAIGIGVSAVDRIFHIHPLEDLGIGLVLSVIATVVNYLMAKLLLKVGKERRSVALEADGRHLMTDVWTSVAVIAAMGLVAVSGWHWLDPLLGFALALHIIIIGLKLVRDAMLGLMDTGLPADDMNVIRNVLDKHLDEGMQYHALATRQAGAWRFMTVHLLVPGNWSVQRGHELAERVEEELRNSLERLHVLTHIEPIEDPVSWDDIQIARGEQPMI
jgi:cation diffusion facilitator family transporter